MLLEAKNISVSFHLRGTVVHAVRNVSFSLNDGEILGIVGESGSGKSVLTHSLLRLLPQPPAKIDGNAIFNTVDLFHCTKEQMQTIRGNSISMIFQDPLSSFNPYLRLSTQLTESLIHHQHAKYNEALTHAIDLLHQTGIPDPKIRINFFPHQFSGGMLQRAMIAMALMSNPRLIIADEPTTALDVTTQAQILGLLKRFQHQYQMSIVFITHNLGIAAGFCDRILVMYAGTIMESADTQSLFKQTAHPYTNALIRCVPSLRHQSDSLYVIEGSPYDPTNPVQICPFANRCEFATGICRSEPYTLYEISSGHHTSCIRVKNGEIKI